MKPTQPLALCLRREIEAFASNGWVAYLFFVSPMRLVVIVLVVFAASAFADTPWIREKIVGLHFYIVDPVRVESYWCTQDGFVAVQIGTHKAIRSPLWHWKIHDGRLQFSRGGSIKQEFTLLDMRYGSLTVRRRSGEIASFRYRVEHQKS